MGAMTGLEKFMFKHGRKLRKSGGKLAEDVSAAAEAAGEHIPRLKKSGAAFGRDLHGAGSEAYKGISKAQHAMLDVIKDHPLIAGGAALGGGAVAVDELTDDDEDDKPKPKKKKRPYMED